jgi:hypothetical protein
MKIYYVVWIISTLQFLDLASQGLSPWMERKMSRDHEVYYDTLSS